MTRSSEQRTKSPIRALSIAWLATLGMLGAFLWCAYDSFQRFTGTAQRNLRIQELRGQIIHMDEVLTMSARLCALTGDPSWETRYREIEPLLESALREVEGASLGVQTSTQTDAANQVLVRIEHEALDLIGDGRRDEARVLLFSKTYVEQKDIYSDGMADLGRQLAEVADGAVRTEQSRIVFQLVGGAIIITTLLVGWVVVVSVVNRGMSTKAQLDRIERDLDVAREIQQGLLPKEAPNTPGFDVVGWSRPADQTGGDYFDWMELPGGGTLITLADVTGHGIGPALIVAVCRAYMRATTAGIGMALEAAMSRVNDLLVTELPPGRFVTAAVGVLQPAKNELLLVSAGQAPLLFYHAVTRTVESWSADDLPLGIMGDLTFQESRRVCFEPGDALVLATDGFFEWANDAGEQYGTERLRAFVAAHAHEQPADFIRGLHEVVVAHAAGRMQPDDLTVVVIKRTGAASAS